MAADRPGITRTQFLVLGSVTMGFALLNIFAYLLDLQIIVAWMQPVSEGFAAAMLFLAGRFNRSYRMGWTLLGLACASYALTDVAWNVLEYGFGLALDESVAFQAAYFLPNLFLSWAVWIYMRKFARIWDMLQLTMDISLALIVVLDTVWVAFFRSWFTAAGFGDLFGLITLMYILADIFCITLVLVMSGIVPLKQVSTAVRVLTAGYLLYILADVLYGIVLYRENYVVGDWTDLMFTLSLILIGAAGLIRLRESNNELPEGNASSMPDNVRWKPMLFATLTLGPLFLLFKGDLRVIDVVIVLCAYVLHLLLTGFNHLAVRNALLVKRERGISAELEFDVATRTAELMAMNRDLENLAFYDSLTGMANRRYFQQLLGERLDKSPDAPLVLFHVNLDRFKHVNDCYGQEMGDRVLRVVAHRLADKQKEDMISARIGGDEFAIAVPGMSTHDDAEQMVQRILGLFEDPIEIDPWSFVLSASIGVAIWPVDAQDLNLLLSNANTAMFHAKQVNGTHHAFYSSWFSQRMRRRHEIEMSLRKADYDKEFDLHYQPQFLCGERSLIGMEALLRWHSPDLGLVSPVEFIPVAEETGIIVAIGNWVTDKALAQISDWNGRFGGSLRMGINFSPKQFDINGFIDSLKQRMDLNGAKPEWVDVEITESVAMRFETATEEILTALANLGVSISIDDFGTGYSSLSYIKRFDIDALKIAKPLVDSLTEADEHVQIVRAIVMMAEAMHLRTIAEGVETEEQLDVLTRIGCGEIQGYLLGKPMPAEEFEQRFL